MQVLLRGAADAPDEVALDLPLVPQADLEMMLTEFNDTLAPFPADKTINQLFEAHAAAQPDTPCLRAGDAVLTYAEVGSLQAARQAFVTCRKMVYGVSSMSARCSEDIVNITMPEPLCIWAACSHDRISFN